VVSRALKKVRDNVLAECLQAASSLAQSSVNTGLIDATSLVDEFFLQRRLEPLSVGVRIS
jgi:hypothetical protein